MYLCRFRSKFTYTIGPNGTRENPVEKPRSFLNSITVGSMKKRKINFLVMALAELIT